MKRIYKYQLSSLPTQSLQLPKDSTILSVTSQRGNIVLYATVDTESKTYERYTITLVGTGHNPPNDFKFLGTVKLREGAYMFHVFYKLEKDE